MHHDHIITFCRLAAIGKGCKNLRYLDISECPHIIKTKLNLYNVLSHFSLLESFAYSIHEKEQIPEELVKNIVKYMVSLNV